MRIVGLLASLVFACATSSAFAGILVVDAANGPGANFTDLQAAVDAAVEGDTILVRSGIYPALVIEAKSLLVVADTDAVVHVISTARIRKLATNQFVLLRGIDATGSTTINPIDVCGITVDAKAGAVWLDDCVFTGAFAYSGMRQSDSPLVSVHRTQATGGNSTAFFYPATNGGAGIVITAMNAFVPPNRLFAWDSTFSGGRGADGTPQQNAGTGGNGVDAQTGANIRLEGIDAVGGTGGDAMFPGKSNGSGGPGMYCADHQNSPAAVVYRETSFVGGIPGQVGPGFGSGVNGVPIFDSAGISVALPGSSRHYDATSPGRAGSTVALTFAGLPNELAFLFVAAGPTSQVVTSSAIDGPLLLPLPLTLLAAIPLGATGQFATSVTVPQLPPGIDTVTVWTQALFASGTSAVAANGNAITLLATGF